MNNLEKMVVINRLKNLSYKDAINDFKSLKNEYMGTHSRTERYALLHVYTSNWDVVRHMVLDSLIILKNIERNAT
jgi:hypothetical protein